MNLDQLLTSFGFAPDAEVEFQQVDLYANRAVSQTAYFTRRAGSIVGLRRERMHSVMPVGGVTAPDLELLK